MNTLKDASSILRACVPGRLPVLLISSPGLGKTAICGQVAKDLGLEYRVIYPTDLDPVDLGGLPIPQGDRVVRMLDDQLGRLTDSDCPPTLLLVDELGQASPLMQAACAKLFLAREIGGKKLSDSVAVVAATNRAGDRAGAGNILSHIVSRMATVLEIGPDYESWAEWARRAGLDETVRGLLAWRSNLLHQFDAGAGAGLKPYPCPRSWERASQLCAAIRDEALLYCAMVGCVGEGPATELAAYRKTRAGIDFEALMSGGKITIPKEPSLLYALAIGVASRVRSDQQMSRALDICRALIKSGKAEIAALLLRESTAWAGWSSSAPVAAAISDKSDPIAELLHAL
jgi:hypothetical protein